MARSLAYWKSFVNKWWTDKKGSIIFVTKFVSPPKEGPSLGGYPTFQDATYDHFVFPSKKGQSPFYFPNSIWVGNYHKELKKYVPNIKDYRKVIKLAFKREQS